MNWRFWRSRDAGNEAHSSRATVRASRERSTIPTAARAVKGRKSVDEEGNFFAGSLAILKPLASIKQWRDFDLDSATLDRLPLDAIVELIVDVSPDISRGVWDFLRMVNPGWTLKVYALTSETADEQGTASTLEREEDTAAKEYLNTFLTTLRTLYGDQNVVFNKIILGGYLRGGFLAELVLGAKGDAVDLVTPDPASLEWQQTEDSIRGPVWKFGQQQSGGTINGFVVLSDYPTIKYAPIDALPGKPYGRAPVHPALFPALFLIALLRDLKRVVAQQGYPRLDLEIVLEKLITAFGEDIAEDPEAMKAAVEEAISQVKAIYAALQPDDAYIHTDVVKVNRPVGTVDSHSLGAIDKLVLLLERMMTRALKSMPLMMGTAEGTSEANANRQWEIYTASIKAIQHSVECILESLFSVALQAAGLQGVVEFRFAVLRASEELRDAQTEKLRIENAREKYNAGWITQDEASIEVTGHKAVEPEPRMQAMTENGGGVANPLDTNPEPGENRFLIEALQHSPRFARNAVTLAALMTLATGEPSDAEQREATTWWTLNAPDSAAELIEADFEE